MTRHRAFWQSLLAMPRLADGVCVPLAGRITPMPLLADIVLPITKETPMPEIPDDKALLLEAHTILERATGRHGDQRTRALLAAIEARFPREDELLHLFPGNGTTRCGIDVVATLPRPLAAESAESATCQLCLLRGIAELRRQRDMIDEALVTAGQQQQRLQLRFSSAQRRVVPAAPPTAEAGSPSWGASWGAFVQTRADLIRQRRAAGHSNESIRLELNLDDEDHVQRIFDAEEP